MEELPEVVALDYTTSVNRDKSMAIFGGSFCKLTESDICKRFWLEQLNISWTDYGINGAGYSNLAQVPGVQYEMDCCRTENRRYDIYLLWSPSNDFTKVGDNIGLQSDYTTQDGYDTTKLQTMLGGMNYCYQQIMEMNPEAQILLFTTLPVFHVGYKGYATDCTQGIGLQHYVDAEIEWARRHRVCYIDLFRAAGFTPNNYGLYYQPDALHPSERGYEHLKRLTANFIAFPEAAL